MNNHPHSISQTDLPLDLQILNISVNMARIGNWISNLEQLKADRGIAVYKSRLELIKRIISQTEHYLKGLNEKQVSDRFRLTLRRFKDDFGNLKTRPVVPESHLLWVEKALTWANILQHRAKLA